MINFENYNLEQEIEKIKNTTYSHNDFLDWYSHKKILSKIYNINPKDIDLLQARIYHSIPLADYELDLKTALNTQKILICNRTSQEKYIVNKGRKKSITFSSGALFPRYKNLKNFKLAPNRKGTIAFPVHKSTYIDTNVDWQDYIDKLKALPEEFQPVSVSIYWRDLLRNGHEIFLKNGIKVYSSGHCCDPDFCDNFYEILSHHKYATTNYAVSSSLMYAMDFGLNIFLYDNPKYDKENLTYNKKFKSALDKYGVTEEEFNIYTDTNINFGKKVFPQYPETKVTEENRILIIEKLGLNKNGHTQDNILRFAMLKQIFLTKIKAFLFIKEKTKKKKYTKYTLKIFNCIKISYKKKN